MGVHPCLVSVSHHISGGTILRDVRFDEGHAVLRGLLETKPGIPVVLFGGAPSGWILSPHAQHHATQSSVGGWQAEVRTTGQRTPFEVAFEQRI